MKEEGHSVFKHKLKNEELMDVEIYSGPIQVQGRTVLFSIVHDITEKVRAESEKESLIKEKDEQRLLFQAVIDNAPAGILVVRGEDMSIKWVNSAYLTFLDKGHPVKDYRGSSVQDLFTSNDELLKAIESVVKSRKPFTNSELERTDRSGRSTYWGASAVPLKDVKGSFDILMLLVNVTDQVDARKRMEEMTIRIDEEKKKLETIFDTLPVGIVVVDSGLKVTQTNDMLDRIWGEYHHGAMGSRTFATSRPGGQIQGSP